MLLDPETEKDVHRQLLRKSKPNMRSLNAEQLNRKKKGAKRLVFSTSERRRGEKDRGSRNQLNSDLHIKQQTHWRDTFNFSGCFRVSLGEHTSKGQTTLTDTIFEWYCESCP